MKPEISLWRDEDPEFTLDPRLHSQTVLILPQIVQHPNSTYNISAHEDIQFDSAAIDPCEVVGSERRITLVSGNTELDLTIKVYNEAMGILGSDNDEDELNKQYRKKQGFPISTIIVSSKNDPDSENYSGVHGLIHIWQKPYVVVDLAHGTAVSNDETRQAELEAVIEALGLDKEIMLDLHQGGQMDEAELRKLNILLHYLSETDKDTISVAEIPLI
jgi:hypothetical protein